MASDPYKSVADVHNEEHDDTAEAKKVLIQDSSGSPIGPSNPLPVAEGFQIPKFDYVALTYVAAGNGEGEIETATFKTGGSGGTTVAILTLTYDADCNILTVTQT